MSSPEALAKTIKAAILDGSASSSTVTALQTLLSGASKAESQNTTSQGTRQRPVPKPVRATKSGTATKGRPQQAKSVPVLEDAPNALPPKARYALATDVVNITLKVLADRPLPNFKGSARKTPRNHDGTPKRTELSSQRALQPLSGNSTPAPATPCEKPAPLRRTSRSFLEGTDTTLAHFRTIAECARTAFSCLRCIDAKNISVRELPRLQLETGMVALCGRLINLRLFSLAVSELRVVKKLLEILVPPVPKKNRSKVNSAQTTTSKETLAGLLELKVDLDACPEAWDLIFTYQMHILHAVALMQKPAAAEEALQYLQIDRPGSPADLIKRITTTRADNEKSARQLEGLSCAILRLCPSTNKDADVLARDAARSPSPLTTFKLQTLSLQVRREMWRLAKHEVDDERDVLQPFSRSLSTLLRRLPSSEDGNAVYSVCRTSYEKLMNAPAGLGGSSEARFNIYKALSVLAERTFAYREATDFASLACESCKALGSSNASFVAAQSRKLSLLLHDATLELDDNEVMSVFECICHSLQQSLSGSQAEYEVLLLEVSHLLQAINDVAKDQQQMIPRSQIAGAAAAFASRFAKSFPGQNSTPTIQIIRFALSWCGSDEGSKSWVSPDTAQVLLQAGVLRAIGQACASKPLTAAWSSSSNAIALGRLLKILVVHAASSGSQRCLALLSDDESLDGSQRGALLEWQMNCALDVAHKPKNKSALQRVLPELLKKLAMAYTAAEFPLRRARVASLALRTREMFIDLIPPHNLQVWLNTTPLNDVDLAMDVKLSNYSRDIKASFDLALAFHTGRPTVDALSAPLLTWQAILIRCRDSTDLQISIESASILLSQLASLEIYFSMLGEDKARLATARLLRQASDICGTSSERYISEITSVRAFLSLGLAEQAAKIMTGSSLTLDDSSELELENLDYELCRAEHSLAMDELDQCRDALERARQVRLRLQPQKLRSSQSKWFKISYGRSWLVQSQYLLAAHRPGDALDAAKRAVKVMNSIWASLDNGQAGNYKAEPNSDEEDSSIKSLTTGVSKLQLKPDARTPSKSQKGASFWPLVRPLFDSLLHLSVVYTHHGSFSQANYPLEEAIKIAESVGSQELLFQARYHRCILLVAAGRLEEAELCLAQDGDEGDRSPSIRNVSQLRAKAALRLKEGDPEKAYTALEKAERIARDMQSDSYQESLDRLSIERAEPAFSKQAREGQNSNTSTVQVTASRRPGTKHGAKPSTPPAIRTKNMTTTAKARVEATAPNPLQTCYVLQKLEASIALDRMILMFQLGRGSAVTNQVRNMFCAAIENTFGRRHLEHVSIMQEVAAALQADFSFNVLSESTLAFPALQGSGDRLSRNLELVSAKSKSAGTKTIRQPKSKKGQAVLQGALETLLSGARRCMSVEIPANVVATTYQTHRQSSMLCDATLLLSATASGPSLLRPVQEALGLEHGRIYASNCQLTVARQENKSYSSSDLLAWPALEDQHTQPSITARAFQSDYIDILPEPWTAVSMGLSEACDELYIARYRRGLSPLILRLPFSRQRSEDPDDEIFDLKMGTAELKDIIELSNYSCHNPGDAAARGAKKNWWSEREALDRRLHELLLNIENIWLGGFKGVLSQQRRNEEYLARFRKDFEAILDRHLPSRKALKPGAHKLTLHDQILELFIGLGNDQDGEVDLDEPLADLLYFLVDILQFNGERNAYDEIDFDSMGIEVLDALRTYHGAIEDDTNDNAHLILVLDRRLQSFPWESMPCLEKSSVSRVDSMLTLRERILQMRQRNSECNGGQHRVPRTAGSYVLNPSADLISTESTLGPVLSKLENAHGNDWKSIIRREPTEDEFTDAITSSSTLLYFGHGAGLQYIRPRAIRRLEKCSEVVWLMGCSSGAVTEYDELEPFAVPLAYLTAGQSSTSSSAKDSTTQHDKIAQKCMAVVATLWDVTDKDIDRFSLAVGEEWGLWSSSNAATKLPPKTPRKREKVVALSTPERPAKTPKTPKIKKTPVAATTPARSQSRSRGREAGKASLVQAVARSRDACYLRYLNGAAPVVYGVPVYLGH